MLVENNIDFVFILARVYSAFYSETQSPNAIKTADTILYEIHQSERRHTKISVAAMVLSLPPQKKSNDSLH